MVAAVLVWVIFILSALLAYWLFNKKKNLSPQWLHRYTDGELTGVVKMVGTIIDKEWELLNYGQYSRSQLSGGGYDEIVVHQTYNGLLKITVECLPNSKEKITEISWRSTTTDEVLSEKAIQLEKNKMLVERAKTVLSEVRNHFIDARAALAANMAKN